MAFRNVVRGSLDGSLFKFGRAFGVHNPFGSNIGKAKDPFLNVRTLCRLSRGADLQVRNAAAKNMEIRLLHAYYLAPELSHKDVRYISAKFDPSLLANVLEVVRSKPELSNFTRAFVISVLTPRTLKVLVPGAIETYEAYIGNYPSVEITKQLSPDTYRLDYSHSEVEFALQLLVERKESAGGYNASEILHHLMQINRTLYNEMVNKLAQSVSS